MSVFHETHVEVQRGYYACLATGVWIDMLHNFTLGAGPEHYIRYMSKKWVCSLMAQLCRIFQIRDRLVPFFQSEGSCPVCKGFLNKRHITVAISVFNCFKTTGLMESGPAAALSGFRFDKSFRKPLRSI